MEIRKLMQMMVAMKKIENRDEWERVRARGHRHWVLWEGVIRFGGSLIVFLLIYFYVVRLFFSFETTTPGWVLVVFLIVMATGGGYIAGDLLWHQYEDRFG